MSVYYVRTCGNDANDGLTPATAFRTIQRAVDVWKAACETNNEMLVYVGPGIYGEFTTTPGGSTDADCRPYQAFGPNLNGRRLIICGDSTGFITGDPPGRVETGDARFYVWTDDIFYDRDPVCTNGYTIVEIRNMFNVNASCGFYNRNIHGYASVPMVVGMPGNPPPVNKDTISLVVKCYNCQGIFGCDDNEDPGVVLCFNCVGTFRNLHRYDACYNLDLGTQAWNSIGIFKGYDVNNRVGAYYCCVQSETYTFKGTGTFNGDPKFVDNINYYLRADSPCINTGCNIDDRPTDIMGVRAPQGITHDMGIHEYVSDLFYNDLNITKPRYGGYDVIDYVEGTIPILVPVDGHYPLITIYVQIATDPSFTPKSIIINTCSDYGSFEYQDINGNWHPYPLGGAGQGLYGLPFRCNVYNLSSPKGVMLFLKTWAVYK